MKENNGALELMLQEPAKDYDFWILLDQSNKQNDGYSVQLHIESLEKELRKISDEGLAQYHLWFREKMLEAYTWEIWAAAWLTPDTNNNQGCGNDSFDDFRAGLIARGKATFDAVLRDADWVAEIKEADQLKSAEGFINAANRIYQERHGSDSSLYYLLDTSAHNTPSGREWREDDAQYFTERLPKTVKKWGIP